ncbi:SDR family NAD(P)-dependent oxidoreductase [Legionella nagasakiensis]|uniref:SDR family NAD(P)-dependent oxidoreductase n=1 Tax=Legionella nagasakiensis TaxID=535290 RepID=UPI0010549093|nr:SDR family oxidoreductase [Legionella nagasakiensis]
MNILITGGSSEIAEAIARRRIAMGDHIMITCSSEKTLEQTLQHYQERNLSVTGFVYNFRCPERSEQVLQDTLKNQIDALILNAFTRVTRFRRLHELPVETIEDYIAINLKGNIWLIHYLLPMMLKHHFGRLIFISSVSSIAGTSGYGAYCTAKAALEGLFLNLAVDYSADNILANIVRAGLFKTERTRKFWSQPGYQEKMAKIIPQGCMGEPQQIAEALDPLLSSSTYMTGSILTVSGGLPLIRSAGFTSS